MGNVWSSKKEKEGRILIKKAVFFVILIVLCGSSVLSAGDFRNFFGINWNGNACENLAYAKTMGYDYVVYQYNMEKCPNTIKANMSFYFGDPEFYLTDTYYTWMINTSKSYSQTDIDRFNQIFAWKGNANESTEFPYNLATGWWFGPDLFRANPDFQQQEVIDKTIDAALVRIRKLENTSIGWNFGGYAWDVPDLTGDWWSSRQSAGGVTINISYWNNGIESSKIHGNITHEYATYSEARASMYKQLFNRTIQEYPDMKIYYQPYNIYSFIKTIQNRSDRFELMPYQRVILCQESADSPTDDLRFMNDNRIYASGLITRDYVCNDNPDNHDHDRNTAMVATAAINGGWMSFFGRWGGTNGAPSYSRVYEVPNRLKFVRVVAGWDNLNGIALENRSWSGGIYQSTLSYIDADMISSVHPKNKMTYVVVINPVNVNVSGFSNIYTVDSLFELGQEIELNSNLQPGTYALVTKNITVENISGNISEVLPELPKQENPPEILPLKNEPQLFGQNHIESYSYVTTYEASDLENIISDGIGTFLASIVSNIELLVICVVLLMIGYLFGGKKWL